jgi:Uma2 family endonuclease
MVAEVQRHLITVEEYERMGEAGIFSPKARLELIDGEIREMAPIGPAHAGIVNALTELFIMSLGRKVTVTVQNPVRLGEFTEPQPDLTVARHRDDRYKGCHPVPNDILILVEVADTTLHYDHTEKMPRYAQAGVPEFWLVDVGAEQITVYTEPTSDGYAAEQVLYRGDEIASTTIAELRLRVDEIFG